MKKNYLHYLIMLARYSFIGVFLQCVLFSLLIASSSNAQKHYSVKEVEVELEINSSDLAEVFALIESVTPYKFIYYESDILDKARFTMKKKKVVVSDLLLDLSKSYNVAFKQVNSNITVKKLKEMDNSPKLEIIIQTKNVSGRVTAQEDNQPLPGVNVVEKGTTNGTITDMDGRYSLEVQEGATLMFSSVGYIREELSVGNRSVIDLTMVMDIKSLEEIVVVGYGVQKKSVVTGSITSVKASDLETMPVTRVEQSLQGRTSGITVAASSGQPGSGSTVRIRGLTTINNNDPLWVVDGVVVDNGGIGYLNQSDIESIEVLKDASSQAIYGARAAAGVILVTTKKGKSGELQVNYNGHYGISAPARKLDLLNATQYAVLRNEASVAAGNPIIFENPQSLGRGTDWQDVIFNKDARRQNHELSFSGGNDVSTFFMSFGLLDQEGIVTTEISKYSRYNVRLNSSHKVKEWLNFGQNLGYSYDKSIGLGNTNSEFGGPLSSAINLDPITPLVITDPAVANTSPYTFAGIKRDKYGNPYGISNIVGQEMTNPLAYVQNRLGNYNWAHNIVGNVYVELEPLTGLRFRSTIGTKLAFWGGEIFTPISYLNATNISTRTSFDRSTRQRFDWNIENTVSYSRTLNAHSFNILLGQGAYVDDRVRGINVTYFDIPVDNFNDASLNYNVPAAQRVSSGYENADHKVSSIFARLNYDFNEKYLFTGVVRRDGSSRFGGNNKYGYFPSFSAGWVASREAFWPINDIVNFMKIRGGYGVVGNDNMANFAFLSTIGGGRNYSFGTDDGYLIGYSPNAPSNPDLKWEETSQSNIGLELTVLQSLNITFDWYKKVTSGILRQPRIPGYIGAISNPYANVADMENSGVELELGYQRQIGDVNIKVNGNVSHLKNRVTNLGDGIDYLDGGQTFHASTYPITRTAVGQPLNSFYGFEILGIFQNAEDVRNHKSSEGIVIQPNAKPGDFIWADRDDDGSITQADRTFIGNPMPEWTFGLTFNAEYKGVDLVVFGQGVAGNKIFQGLRRLDVANANWQTKALGRWTGEGTSTDYPRLVHGDPNKNFGNPSKFYLEDGDYFRIKTIQLGYNFPQSIISKAGFNGLRIYLMSENLLTFTKYTGYDPEIGGGVMSIDRGIYPQARSYMVGLNFGF